MESSCDVAEETHRILCTPCKMVEACHDGDMNHEGMCTCLRAGGLVTLAHLNDIARINIKVGDTFIQGEPGKVQQVYRIEEISEHPDMVRCVEVRLINASPLAKINTRDYFYPSSIQIKEWILQNGRGEE